MLGIKLDYLKQYQQSKMNKVQQRSLNQLPKSKCWCYRYTLLFVSRFSIFYCSYLVILIFITLTMQPKGKLAAQLNSILQDLKSQNRQINSTLKSLKKAKSQETFRAKPSQSVIQHPNIDRIIKSKKPIEVKVKKSKTFHRCSSCKFIGSNQNKQNCEKPKEKVKIIPKKVKTLSLLQIQRKSYLKLGKSPVRKSNITTKYMAILDTKRTKRL